MFLRSILSSLRRQGCGRFTVTPSIGGRWSIPSVHGGETRLHMSCRSRCLFPEVSVIYLRWAKHPKHHKTHRLTCLTADLHQQYVCIVAKTTRAAQREFHTPSGRLQAFHSDSPGTVGLSCLCEYVRSATMTTNCASDLNNSD